MTKQKRTYSSTHEEMMQKPGYKEGFDKKYRELLMEELLIAIMQGDKPAIQWLAKEAGLPIIEDAKTQRAFRSVFCIIDSLGYDVEITRKNSSAASQKVPLNFHNFCAPGHKPADKKKMLQTLQKKQRSPLVEHRKGR